MIVFHSYLVKQRPNTNVVSEGQLFDNECPDFMYMSVLFTQRVRTAPEWPKKISICTV